MGGLIGRPTHPEFPADPPTQKWPTPTGGGGCLQPVNPPPQEKNFNHHSIDKGKKNFGAFGAGSQNPPTQKWPTPTRGGRGRAPFRGGGSTPPPTRVPSF